MSLQQKMHFESGLLSVEASGDFSLEDAKLAFLEMLGAVVQYKAGKILFDGQNAKGNPKDMERFYYGEFAARETRGIVVEHKIVPRFAYVLLYRLVDYCQPYSAVVDGACLTNLEAGFIAIHTADAVKPVRGTDDFGSHKFRARFFR